MSTRIGNRIFRLVIVALILFWGVSCVNPISEMEKLVGMPMKEALTPIMEENQWYEFNGDGYKIKVYQVKRDYLERYNAAFKSKGFKEYGSQSKDFNEYDPASWKQSEVYSYIKNSHGLYKRFSKNQEVIYVFLNLDAGTIIYWLIVL